MCIRLVKDLPRNDANIFPEYVLPSIAPLAMDNSVVVRIAYARNVGKLNMNSPLLLRLTKWFTWTNKSNNWHQNFQINSGYCWNSFVLPGSNTVEFGTRESNRSVRNGIECIAWNVASNGITLVDRLTANCQTNGYRMWHNKAVRIFRSSESKRSDTIAYDHISERQGG